MKRTAAVAILALLATATSALWLRADEEDKIAADAKALKARDNVANVRAIAKKWKEDAILVGLLGNMVKDNGTVDASSPDSADAYWEYCFFSPATKFEGEDDTSARLSITLVGGKVEKTPAAPTSSDRIPLPDDFVDSDRVWAAAKKKDPKAAGTAQMVLGHHPEMKDHPFQWDFTSEAGSLSIDSKSGDPVGAAH